jgi:hypothetical protein
MLRPSYQPPQARAGAQAWRKVIRPEATRRITATTEIPSRDASLARIPDSDDSAMRVNEYGARDGLGIAARVFTAVCCGLDRAIKCLEAWGLQRGTAAITISLGR